MKTVVLQIVLIIILQESELIHIIDSYISVLKKFAEFAAKHRSWSLFLTLFTEKNPEAVVQKCSVKTSQNSQENA